MTTAAVVPAFARGVRLKPDGDLPHLLIPEGFLRLNPTAVATLREVDGKRSAAEIAAVLQPQFSGATLDELERDVLELLTALHDRALVVYR